MFPCLYVPCALELILFACLIRSLFGWAVCACVCADNIVCYVRSLGEPESRFSAVSFKYIFFKIKSKKEERKKSPHTHTHPSAYNIVFSRIDCMAFAYQAKADWHRSFFRLAVWLAGGGSGMASRTAFVAVAAIDMPCRQPGRPTGPPSLTQ